MGRRAITVELRMQWRICVDRTILIQLVTDYF